MTSVQEVPADKLIDRLKEKLKEFKEISPPRWALYAKSGAHKERPPEQSDFWFIRAASILRRLYIDGPIGTSRLRTYYGGRKRRGHKPAHTYKASGAIIRKILQQLEASGLVRKENKKGRVLTSKGRKLLDAVVGEIIGRGKREGS